jgi:hypothetical protein
MNQKLFLASFISLLIFSECKKGPDDPFISLRSRKARVAGDWKLSSGTETSSSNYSGGSSIHQETETTTYDGSSYTTVTDETVGPTSYHDTETGAYSLKVSFKKDGSFEMEESRDGDASTSKGTWNFTGKVGDLKNKEQIVLSVTSESGSGYSSTSSGNQVDKTFNIKELRNKKMVLVFEEGSTSSDTFGSTTSTSTDSHKLEYVLEQ